MPMDMDVVEQMIKQAIPDAEVTMSDLVGDGDHLSARVVSAQFAGKTRVQQHKMVFDALGDKMGGELHALAVQTVVKEGN